MYIKKIFKKLQLDSQKGIGLVEVMAAFSISMVVITSLVALALFTLRSSLNSKLLLEATKIGNREIERVRAFRDVSPSWQQFLDDLSQSAGGVDCSCASAAACSGSNAKKCNMAINPISPRGGSVVETIDNQRVTYFFNITPDPNDPDNIVRVTVEVSWSVAGQNKYTHVYTDLSNWAPK